MTTPFGAPFQQIQRSTTSELELELTLGYDVSNTPTNLRGGATPNSDNFIMREGRLEPRPMLSGLTDAVGATAPELAALGFRNAGGLEHVDVNGVRTIILSNDGGSLVMLQGSSGTWAGRIPFAGGIAPALSGDAYWDWTQIFYDQANDNAAIGVTSDRQGIYAAVPSLGIASVLTGSPGAKCVVAFDHYILAGNTEENGETFIQRVRWCDRGSISSWTGGLSGFEDLLGAKGELMRMLPLDAGVVLFFEDEIWKGAPVEFPNIWRFTPFDPTLGCPYPRTATVTPKGVMFMSRNFQVHLIPKDGSGVVPIGTPIHRSIRSNIAQAKNAFSAYDGLRDLYQLYYAKSGDSAGVPRQAVWLDMMTGAWAPQSFGSHALSTVFQANLSQDSVPTWDDVTTAWDNMGVSWNALMGLGNERQTVVAVASHGTAYELRSTATNDFGQPVLSFWESRELGGGQPGQQKTLTEIRLDYAAESRSTVSVRALNVATFSAGTALPLPVTSRDSQAIAYPYDASRYPAVRLEATDQQGYSLKRLQVLMRIGAR